MHSAEISSVSAAVPQLDHGIALLDEAFGRHGFSVTHSPLTEHDQRSTGDHRRDPDGPADTVRVLVGSRSEPAVAALEDSEHLLYTTGAPGAGGFHLSRLADGRYVVTGGDDNGVLYGCQELARLLVIEGRLPEDLDHGQTPDLAVRGPAVGLQKTTVEPDRQTYEYPVTPDRFDWFYDRRLWTDFLDLLFEQRANVLYLWSGHPFASFVSLPDYPEALEVSDDQLRANQKLLHWLVAQATRRGIRLMLKFYNIHIPLPFAQRHQIPLRQPKPTPLVSDYTRDAISTFVATFPEIGLYVCLGEVLQGDIYGSLWLNEVILPAIKDGAAAAGVAPPPVILRAHALDLIPVLQKAQDHYPWLMTEAKYNGESLTTATPRGKWQQIHRQLAELADTHIVNVHILANLEPFRFGAVSFIQRCVQAMRHRLDAGGLHLYPMFYWEWPLSPDRDRRRIRQLDRDWIWFEAWHRYAWHADRDRDAEREYWIGRLAEHFGSRSAGIAALDGYEALGQIAPRLVRRLGITEGNRQTLSLGMTMSQLINPDRHRAWADLWESHAPQGERLDAFVERELTGDPHVGETPLSVTDDARRYAAAARVALDRGWPAVSAGVEEYARLCSDAEALGLIADFYALRVAAAVDVLSYQHRLADRYSSRVELLERAADTIDASVRTYRRLAKLTGSTYRYANSMQTPQRKIPFPDGKRYGHWQQCLGEYEAELANFAANIARLVAGEVGPDGAQPARPDRFTEVDFRLACDNAETFLLTPGSSVFADTDGHLRTVAPELTGLTGIRINKADGFAGVVPITVTLDEPAQVLIGHFDDDAAVWLRPPDLETDTHAEERGGALPVLRRGLGVDFHPRVNIHALKFEAGTHTLELGRGAYVVAGVTSAEQPFSGRTVGTDDAATGSPDWLFEAPPGT